MANTTTQNTPGHAEVTPWFFWKVGIWLTVLTGLEVWAYYIEALGKFLIPILVVLSLFKFVLVIAYFMHLKWDARAYTGFFLFGFFVAVLVYIAVVLMSGPAV